MNLLSTSISLTERCIANCDFCTFRDIFRKSHPIHTYLPLILGSLNEEGFEGIVKENWKENEFLKEILTTSPVKLYFKYLNFNKKSLSDTDNFDKCYLCFLMRKNRKFMENFTFRRKYNFKYKMDLEKWKEVIRDAENLKLQRINIGGGGEPFLEFDKLLKVFEFSSGRFDNIVVTTNGFFANNEYKVTNILKKFKRFDQFFTIGISYDYHPVYKFHQSFIPEKNIINIIKAANKLKIKIFINSIITEKSDINSIHNHLENLTKLNVKLLVTKRENLIEDILGVFKLIFEREMTLADERPVHFISFLKVNPRVEKRINNRDLIKLKPFNNKYLLEGYMHLRDIGLRAYKQCYRMPLILSNGIVISCCSHAF